MTIFCQESGRKSFKNCLISHVKLILDFNIVVKFRSFEKVQICFVNNQKAQSTRSKLG